MKFNLREGMCLTYDILSNYGKLAVDVLTDITGPTGPTGPQGITGQPGLPGQPGQPG